MPTAIGQRRRSRLILLKMMLDLHALIRSRNRPVEETLVDFAIRLGQYDGHPMDAGMISAVTTLPRTSVLRYVKALEEQGATQSSRIGRRVVRYFPLAAEVDEVDAFFDEVERIIRQACDELSNLDTSEPRHET